MNLPIVTGPAVLTGAMPVSVIPLPQVIDLGTFPAATIKDAFVQAHLDLDAYKPPFVTDAVKTIKPLGENLDYDAPDLLDRISFNQMCYMDNFEVMPGYYVRVETMRRILFPGQTRIAGLQLASNYGPYLHYLKHRCGVDGMVGVDSDIKAVDYALAGGLACVHADAVHLPFADSSISFVFSRLFLDFAYLQDESLIKKIAREVVRVLMPGGVFVSQLEESAMDDLLAEVFVGIICPEKCAAKDLDILGSLRMWYKPFTVV